MRNEEVTELLPKFELMRRTDFEGDGSRCRRRLAKLHSRSCRLWPSACQFKAVAEPRYEEEHRTWSVSFTDSQGAERQGGLDAWLPLRNTGK